VTKSPRPVLFHGWENCEHERASNSLSLVEAGSDIREKGGAVSATNQGSEVQSSRGQLRRKLRLWEAIALSFAILAPSLAVGLNGVLPASIVGEHVPFVFVLAFVGVGLVAYSFVRLSKYFTHSGSVYALAGCTIGPRAGFFTGWALLGAYAAYAVDCVAAVALFGAAFLRATGIWPSANWLLIALVAAGGTWILGYLDVRVVTRILLTIEGVSIALIVIVVVVIFARLAAGSAPQHQGFELGPLLPGSVPWSALGLATVFGFLSFAGFEGAASLGEETRNPGKNIPRALVLSLVLMGVFYIVAMYAQTVGFGTSSAGVKAFATSGAPMGDLARAYVGRGMDDVLLLGVTITSFSCAIGCTMGSARMLFAFGRDGFISTRLSTTSARTGSPTTALAVVMTFVFVTTLALRLLAHATAIDDYFWLATIGTLAILVAYLVTSAGGFKFLFIDGRRAPRWQGAIPLLGILFLVYVYWKNVSPVPAAPYNAFPYIVAAWLAAAVVIIAAYPGLARRIGANLADEAGAGHGEDGLVSPDEARTAPAGDCTPGASSETEAM